MIIALLVLLAVAVIAGVVLWCAYRDAEAQARKRPVLLARYGRVAQLRDRRYASNPAPDPRPGDIVEEDSDSYPPPATF